MGTIVLSIVMAVIIVGALSKPTKKLLFTGKLFRGKKGTLTGVFFPAKRRRRRSR